jgi:energy-coupling factor transporter ATP-binding protein EcfA2
MNKIFSEHGIFYNQITSLKTKLRDTKNMCVIYAITNNDTLKYEAIGTLGELLTGKYEFYEFDYEKETDLNLPLFVISLQKYKLPLCIFAYNLEKLDKDRYDSALNFLNSGRGKIINTTVFWLNKDTLLDIQLNYPSFAHWLTPSAIFELPYGHEVEQTALGKLSLTEAEELRNRVMRLEEVLLNPNLDSHSKAKYQEWLAALQGQLGKGDKSKETYKESTLLYSELKAYKQLEGLYRQFVIASFNNLTFYSVAFANPVQIDLKKIFIDITVRTILNPCKSVDKEFKSKSLDILSQSVYSIFLLTGSPGSGKTTLLKYFALKCAHESKHKPLPFFIALKDVNNFFKAEQLANLSLPDFLHQYFNKICPHLNLQSDFFLSILDAKRGIIFLDGLDEVNSDKGVNVVDALSKFINGMNKNIFVITSRPCYLADKLSEKLQDSDKSTEFLECKICDIEENDLSYFINNWYKLTGVSGDLINKISRTSDVRNLLKNPMLLSMLVTFYQHGLKLPHRKVEFFDKWTEQLISLINMELTHNGSVSLLESLALWFHQKDSGSFAVSEKDINEQLVSMIKDILHSDSEKAKKQAESFLGAIDKKAGILHRNDNGTFRFTYRPLQEYLAARAISGSSDYIKNTLQYLHNDSWRNVILLEVAHLSCAKHFGLNRSRELTSNLLYNIRNAHSQYEKTLHRDLLFTVRAILDADRLALDDTLYKDIFDNVIRLWQKTPYDSLANEIADIFAYAMDTDYGEFFQKQLNNKLESSDEKIVFKVLIALRHMSRIALENAIKDKDYILRQLDKIANDENQNSTMRSEVIQTIGLIIKEPLHDNHFFIIKTLKDLLDNTGLDINIRGSALSVLIAKINYNVNSIIDYIEHTENPIEERRNKIRILVNSLLKCIDLFDYKISGNILNKLEELSDKTGEYTDINLHYLISLINKDAKSGESDKDFNKSIEQMTSIDTKNIIKAVIEIGNFRKLSKNIETNNRLFDQLIKLTQHKDEGIRLESIKLLSVLAKVYSQSANKEILDSAKFDESIVKVIELANDNSPTVRRYVVWSLLMLYGVLDNNQIEIKEKLIALKDDKDFQVSVNAARALGQISKRDDKNLNNALIKFWLKLLNNPAEVSISAGQLSCCRPAFDIAFEELKLLVNKG